MCCRHALPRREYRSSALAGFRRLLPGAAAALLIVMGRPLAVLAHAVLLRADPPDICSPLATPRLPADDPRCAAGPVLAIPPTTVRLFFNERVSLIGRGIRVIGPDGRRVDQDQIRVDGPQLTVGVVGRQTGTYAVTWRVVSADTHPARGSFAFSVGHASSPPVGVPGTGGAGTRSTIDLMLQALARSIHFAGYALGFGVLAFHVVVLRPLGLSDAERRVWQLVGTGVALLLIAEPIALLAQATSLGASGALDPEVVSGALESSFGRVLAQRLGAALLLWVLLGAARDASIRATRAVAILGLTLAFVDGQAAHATGARPAWVGLGANTLHVAAMGAWIGAVVALLSVWWLPAVADRRREVAVRVGWVSAAALTVLMASGTVMATQHLAGPMDLLTSAYGRTLDVKLGMLCVVLLLAAAATRASLGERARWWGWEAAALVSVLALAGLLVSLPPPR